MSRCPGRTRFPQALQLKAAGLQTVVQPFQGLFIPYNPMNSYLTKEEDVSQMHLQVCQDAIRAVKAMGLVFGDIGTSPIYTFAVLILLVPPTQENIIGIISLIIWTLIILVTIQYAILAMRISYRGEGGTIMLREILLPLLKSGRSASIVTLLTIIGVSLMIGDCVITPAISILSAVEGFRLIPGGEALSQELLVVVAAMIAILLFTFQWRGTDKVAGAFGPVMLLWFLAITAFGIAGIMSDPRVVMAIFPTYAVSFLIGNGIAGFFILSSVILCATGGEALFADMGQLGREPIRHAWIFVFVALILSYLGQGAFMVTHAGVKNPFFELVAFQAPFLYIPFLILSIVATVIASQAVISGIFSIVYQGITTHLLPLFKIGYTSSELRTQIYIGVVNWFLCGAVLLVLAIFMYSDRLAGAYGLAVTGTMLITGILMTMIFVLRRSPVFAAIAVFVTIVDTVFFLATLTKIPHGGYWSLIMAAVPFSIVMIYLSGQRALYRALNPMPRKEFLVRYNSAYGTANHVKGTALFFARDLMKIPAYISHTMFDNEIMYEQNIIVSIQIANQPFGFRFKYGKEIAPGLRILSVKYGYMQVIDLPKILEEAGIQEKTIFYGMEEIVTNNILWKIFTAIKRLCPSFVQYYKLPAHRIHGVVTRIEL